MAEDLKLVMLKQDLEMLHNKKDDYLKTLIAMAEGFIRREGITPTGSQEDDGLIAMYAAYLYRKRAKDENSMPRMLRWALNNRLISEKAGEAHDG